MKRMVLGVFIWCLSAQVWALSLGEIDVRSSLNQPLDAVIPIITTRAGETYNLQVVLASEADHKNRNVELSDAARGIKVLLVDNELNPYLQVYTNKPIREPALKFMLDASFKGGRVQRNYKVLLNIR